MDLFGKAGLGKATDSVPVRGGFSVDAPGVAHGESRKVLLPTSRSPVVSPTSVSVFGDRGGAGELQSLIAASALTGSTTAIGGGGGGGRAESKFVSSQQTPQGVTVNTSGDSRLDYLVDRLYSLENRISRAEDSLRASRDEVKTGRAETASDLRSLSELVQSGQSRAEEGRKAVEGSVSALSAEIREVRQQAQEGVALATEGSRSASERIEAVLARLERCERDGGALASLGQTLQGGMQSVEKNADGLAERLRLLEQRFASREETVQGLSEGQRDLGRAVRDICGDVEGLRTMVVNLNGTVVGGLRAEVESLCRDLAAVRERSEVANAEVIILRNEVVAGHQQAKAGEERMGEAVQEVDTRLRRHIAEKNDVTLQRIGGVQSEVRGLLDRLEARVDSRLEAVQQRQREASDTFSSALLEVRALMKEMEDSSERRESSLCGNIEGLQKTIEGLQGNLKILQEARERMEEERKWTDDRVNGLESLVEALTTAHRALQDSHETDAVARRRGEENLNSRVEALQRFTERSAHSLSEDFAAVGECLEVLSDEYRTLRCTVDRTAAVLHKSLDADTRRLMASAPSPYRDHREREREEMRTRSPSPKRRGSPGGGDSVPVQLRQPVAIGGRLDDAVQSGAMDAKRERLEVDTTAGDELSRGVGMSPSFVAANYEGGRGSPQRKSKNASHRKEKVPEGGGRIAELHTAMDQILKRLQHCRTAQLTATDTNVSGAPPPLSPQSENATEGKHPQLPAQDHQQLQQPSVHALPAPTFEELVQARAFLRQLQEREKAAHDAVVRAAHEKQTQEEAERQRVKAIGQVRAHAQALAQAQAQQEELLKAHREMQARALLQQQQQQLQRQAVLAQMAASAPNPALQQAFTPQPSAAHLQTLPSALGLSQHQATQNPLNLSAATQAGPDGRIPALSRSTPALLFPSAQPPSPPPATPRQQPRKPSMSLQESFARAAQTPPAGVKPDASLTQINRQPSTQTAFNQPPQGGTPQILPQTLQGGPASVVSAYAAAVAAAQQQQQQQQVSALLQSQANTADAGGVAPVPPVDTQAPSLMQSAKYTEEPRSFSPNRPAPRRSFLSTEKGPLATLPPSANQVHGDRPSSRRGSAANEATGHPMPAAALEARRSPPPPALSVSTPGGTREAPTRGDGRRSSSVSPLQPFASLGRTFTSASLHESKRHSRDHVVEGDIPRVPSSYDPRKRASLPPGPLVALMTEGGHSRTGSRYGRSQSLAVPSMMPQSVSGSAGGRRSSMGPRSGSPSRQF